MFLFGGSEKKNSDKKNKEENSDNNLGEAIRNKIVIKNIMIYFIIRHKI